MSDIRSRIQAQIERDQVVLFMKGERRSPQCGFSATVVSILDNFLEDYKTVDVLADSELRQGIKDFSEWPTIPQLYVRGEFLGGCDIVKEMFASGELETALGVEPEAVAAPTLVVSAEAAEALKAALQGPDEFVRLEVDARYSHGLSIGEKRKGDVEVDAQGLTLLLDRLSAKRAQGVSIDYVDSPDGKAFKINNPNEPPGVQSLSVQGLKNKLDASDGSTPWLLDVRTPAEREIARLPQAKLLDRSMQDEIFALPKETPLYFMCHHGSRSRQAAEFFLNQGFKQVYNVEGGIDAWSQEIDSDIPRY